MKAVVVGIATHQTSVPVDGFPVPYEPVRARTGQIRAHVGGGGFTVARVLAALGDDVTLVAPLGEDAAAATIDAQAYRYGFSTSLCSRTLVRTPRSVILHDGDGRRSFFTDLGDALGATLHLEELLVPLSEADVVLMGNLDLARPVVALAGTVGRPVAVDLQEVRSPDEPGHVDFLAADIISMSNDRVVGREDEVLLSLRRRSRAEVLVMTMGPQGARVLAGRARSPVHVAATDVGPIRSATGAGEVFFASLVHQLVEARLDPVAAVRAACADVGWVATHPDRFGVHDSHP